MGLYSTYATDSNKEANGVPVPFEANEDGTVPTIVIARLGGGNKQYIRALEHAQKPYRRLIQLGTMNKEVHEKLILEVFAQNVVKGWSNVQDAEGKEIPFNVQNAVKLLNDLPELYTDLFNQSNGLELFKVSVLEEDAKN